MTFITRVITNKKKFVGFPVIFCNLFGSSRKKRAIEEKVHVNDTNQNALLNEIVQNIGKEYSFNRKHSA